MAVDIAITGVPVKMTASILNATRNDYGDFAIKVDPFHPPAEIVDGVRVGARGAMLLILNAIDTARRAGFLSLAAFSSGDQIKHPFGAVQIDGKDGTPITDAGKFRRYQRNANNLTTIATAGYYHASGHVVYFIGTDGQVEQIDNPANPETVVPDEYEPLVIANALEFLFPKQGAYLGAAAHFRGVAQDFASIVVGGKVDFPAITPFGTKA